MAEQRTGPSQTISSPAIGAAPNPGAQERQVRLRLDERHLTANYTNAFRTFVTPEELIVDFGMNLVTHAPGAAGSGDENSGEILFALNDRVIMNYLTAKRLAITLSQIVHRHEEKFGEIKLAAADRARM